MWERRKARTLTNPSCLCIENKDRISFFKVIIMAENETQNKGSPLQIFMDSLREAGRTFRDIAFAPRALWGVNISYFLEGLVYFGILTVLTKFLHENVEMSDLHSGWIVGALTGGITLSMFFFGELADRWGVRIALIISLGFLLAGRIFLAGGDTVFKGGGTGSPIFLASCAGILLVVLGYGMYQPASYAAVKQFTDEKTSAMGYAMLYALMNLGGFCSGLLSPRVREISETSFPPNGIGAVFWVYVFLNIAALLSVAIILSKKTVQNAVDSVAKKDSATASEEKPKEKWSLKKWWSEHPFRDSKFVFFIFILIPVQTLFAHSWLTIPAYVDRAYTGFASENFELFSNLNPLFIFILSPLVAALTRKVQVYKMMIYGTLVMAVPTFLLCIRPDPVLLIVYILLMSVGEAMWSPRFLQWIAEVAPEGKTGAYMGIGQFPWFLTKLITSTYSGWFLAHYCPSEGEKNTEIMWFIYGVIALISPAVLYIFRKWAAAKR
jgi:MFS family permease